MAAAVDSIHLDLYAVFSPVLFFSGESKMMISKSGKIIEPVLLAHFHYLKVCVHVLLSS